MIIKKVCIKKIISDSFIDIFFKGLIFVNKKIEVNRIKKFKKIS